MVAWDLLSDGDKGEFQPRTDPFDLLEDSDWLPFLEKTENLTTASQPEQPLAKRRSVRRTPATVFQEPSYGQMTDEGFGSSWFA